MIYKYSVLVYVYVKGFGSILDWKIFSSATALLTTRTYLAPRSFLFSTGVKTSQQICYACKTVGPKQKQDLSITKIFKQISDNSFQCQSKQNHSSNFLNLRKSKPFLNRIRKKFKRFTVSTVSTFSTCLPVFA